MVNATNVKNSTIRAIESLELLGYSINRNYRDFFYIKSLQNEYAITGTVLREIEELGDIIAVEYIGNNIRVLIESKELDKYFE